jgi:hypothetical protein
MLGRFRKGDGGRYDGDRSADERGAVATREEPVTRTTRTERAPVVERERARDPREARATVRARQREEFGGFSWGADFFGWLVAVGVAALLVSGSSAL